MSMNVRVQVIPEKQLTEQQRIHLKFAKQIVGNVPLYPANIRNGIPIIGAYKLQTSEIFIAPKRLERLRYTMNTTIHELAHHRSGADDGTKAHDDMIHKISMWVIADAEKDQYLSKTLAQCVW